jgi:S-phase kinase-associated protein 1
MSELVKVLTEDAGTDEEVPLMDVKTPVLAKVLEFCKHHVENKLPEIEKVGSQLEGAR